MVSHLETYVLSKQTDNPTLASRALMSTQEKHRDTNRLHHLFSQNVATKVPCEENKDPISL